MKPLRIGARASLMSLSQTAPLLAALAPQPMLFRPFSGEGGDREENRAPLEEDGVFSKGIEVALLEGEIDVAVHCLKDAPTEDTPGLKMAVYLKRDDIRDCLVTRHPEIRMRLDDLPSGEVVGTASVRRTAALRTHRPDLKIVPLRGPINERLQALSRGDVDAVIVASCSMERLGLRHLISERISPEIICPPLGAAIIALQTREDDTETYERILKLNDDRTQVEAAVERLVLSRMGGFCNAPLAGYCTTDDSGTAIKHTLRARAFTPSGGTAIDVRLTGEEPVQLAVVVCRRLIRHRALELAGAR
ncbi:hydroxymethylbilane synthase [Streptomyces sp. NPDC058861]|uniref:hydroxymethylbilane synthase n=1 Tax=Streptomyces sp. NPDC058861 TaxID=3346653 RepID=UPI0036CCD337